MSINEIKQALPGERVVALSPEDATTAATDWLRRPNLFAGRALTAPTLENRQRWQAGRIAHRGQAFTPGVVNGLEVSHIVEPNGSDRPSIRVFVQPGQGLAVSGEDVFLPRGIEFLLEDLPIVAPAAWTAPAEGEDGDGEGDSPYNENNTTPPIVVIPSPPASLAAGGGGNKDDEGSKDPEFKTLHSRVIRGQLLDLWNSANLPVAGVLLLQPVTVDTSDFDPTDPCDRCPCGDEDNLSSFEDWRIRDGARLLFYPWPEEWSALPHTLLRRRNAFAHKIFTAESRLLHGQCLPWEQYGVPIAFIGLTDMLQVSYVDRAAVVRQGGRAREARLQLADGKVSALAANSRLPALWQARIEQFAEQIAEQQDDAGNLPPAETLADPFLHLPPCGLLPTSALRLADLPADFIRSDFFPPLFTLDAVPVPMEQLDLTIREAAALAPIDIGVPERLRLLVPVSQASWEPRLLQHDVIDPEFDATVQRFLLDRARALGARQGLRSKAALLAHALDGQQHPITPFNDDPLAVETETLSPWGAPPDGGGHRSSLKAGFHQHFFDSTSTTFTLGEKESFFAWVYLDPENPPRTLMFQWHTKKGWEHRVYLGENLIELGEDGSASRFPLDEKLPKAGAWTMIKVPAAKLGMTGQEIDGMAFCLYDGRAAFGQCGGFTKDVQRNWFSNFVPPDAKLQGDEPWDLLTHNDLWAPFERDDGVTTSLPEVEVAVGGLPGQSQQNAEAELAIPKSGFSIYHPLTQGWRGHLIMVQSGMNSGPVTTGPVFTSIKGSETLDIWVYLDELNPPRSIWAYVACFGQDASNNARGTAYRLAFWGENRLAELNKVLPLGDGMFSQTVRAGALPRTGVWTRLQMPQPDGSQTAEGASKLRLWGGIFMAFGGEVAFSDMAVNPAAAGAADMPAWPLEVKEGTPLPPFTPYLNATPALQTSLEVLSPTTSGRIGTVKVMGDLVTDPLIARLSQHERSQLPLRGLMGFADYLRMRIDRADDITDFGFAHMQVDMARIRNMMMSTSDASRLAVSPTLAAIAKSDSALNVQAQIKEYLGTVKKVSTARSTPAVPAAAPRAVSMAKAVASVGVSNVQYVQVAAQARLIQAPKAPLNIVYARPVIGLSEVRTTAIADRLRQPPSTEARDYALSNRHRTVSSLLDLLAAFMKEDSGDVPALLQDFDIFGLEGDPFLDALAPLPAATGKRRKLTDFVGNATLLGKLLSPPPVKNAQGQIVDPDEAALFTQTADLSDNTVATLRQLEGRLSIYRDALTRCDRAIDDLQADVSTVSQRLRQIEEVLAEARHDVGVARALTVEEQARIDAVNTRRKKVLADEVKFLAYVRPRATSNVLAAPRRVVDPALAEAPVPACLRDHDDVPDELEDMLRVVREAPASWFMQVPKLLDKLDRPELLLRAVQSAQLRLPQLAVRAPTAIPVAGRLGNAVTQVMTRQTTMIAQRVEAVSRVNLATLASATWQNLRHQVQDIVSLGDIIDGEHGKGAVARAAADEFNRIGAVCSCLHAEFCGVSAAIRLDWAEMFSQFDDAPNLRNLASLPRWSEIDSIDRRQMQAYVDWLFSQLEPKQAQGEALINDVIRMCLLLASHAPVGRIVAGRLPRPITAVRPGIRIPLVALEPAKLRVGMQAMIYRANTLVARAVVEDVGTGEAAAKVVHTSSTQIDLDVDVRVHFDNAAVVSAAPARVGSIFKR
ncbi:MAG: hypothetical protein REI94_08755 [Moraxellaceae bacterium]|nr:hypothetical protein [Moraxellaceae bacterium]